MPQIVKLILPLLSHQANIFVELFLLLSLEEAAFVNCEILIKLLNVYSKICNFRISLNYNFFLFMFSALPFVLISTVFFVFFFCICSLSATVTYICHSILRCLIFYGCADICMSVRIWFTQVLIGR